MLSPAKTAQNLSIVSGKKAELAPYSVVLLSIMGGAAIGMGSIFWAHTTLGVAENIAPGVANFMGGVAFSVGLLMVVFFGGHIFTSCILSGVTAYDQKLPLPKMLIYWLLVWICNFIGSVFIAYMYFRSEIPMNFDGDILKTFVKIGVVKTHLDFDVAFIRAIFCNIFVCMAVWAGTAATDTAGKILAIVILITAFVSSGYEHCVANMFIISEALMAKAHLVSGAGGDVQAVAEMLNISVDSLQGLNIKNFLLTNLVPVTIGNIIGGLGFVGLVGFISHRDEMNGSSD